MAVFVACGAWMISRGAIPLIWLAAVVATQLMEHWIAAPLRVSTQGEPAPGMKVRYFLTLCVVTLVYSSIATYLWFLPGLPGKLFGFLLPAGSLLNNTMQLERAPRALLPTAAPHALYLVGLPLAYGAVSPEQDLVHMGFVSLGALVFIIYVAAGVRRGQRNAYALRVARDEAEEERRRAERANAAKSDFLATISHEIRTPLNAVVAAATLLRRTRLDDDQWEHVEMLTHSAELLTGLLKDVLDLSKIEAGKLVLETAPVDLVQELANTTALWRARAAEKGLTIRFQAAALPARVVTDPLRLQQIVFNFLSNAVKFTDQGAIELRGGLCPGGARLWLEVEDSGCGMDAEAQRRVFEPFEQAATDTTRRYGGTGLGLSISRRLAELLGGEITVTSTPGRGSTFRLEIPFIEAQPAADPPAPESSECLNAAGDPIEVLLAEDHPVNQRIVRLMLEPLGISVTVAGDGAEALNLATQRPFDVILMDMQMPVMGGVEAARRIKGRPGPNADAPILALTANAMDEQRAQWAAVGVETLLAKPIDMQRLIAAVRAAALTRRDLPVLQAAVGA